MFLSLLGSAVGFELPAGFEDALVVDHTPETMTARWYAETAGTNLALGRAAVYRPQPNWAPCIDANDAWQLTDGVILYPTQDGLSATEQYNKLRTSLQAVAWHEIETPAHIVIDLGNVYSIQRVVVRYQGGYPEVHDFPVSVTVAVSEDGQNFYRVGRYENANGPREGPYAHYRMPILGEYATIFPFVIGEMVTKARYVGIQLAPRGDACLDEIAVIQGDVDPTTIQYNPSDLYPFPTGPAAVLPRDNMLYVPNNVDCIQSFPTYNDLSRQGTDVTWVVELPAGVWLSEQAHHRTPSPDYRTAQDELFPAFYDQAVPMTRDGEPYTRYIFKYAGPYDDGPQRGTTLRLGPLFLQTSRPAGGAGNAWFYAQWAGGQQNPVKVPIEVYSMPPPNLPKRLHVSLGWMGEFLSNTWPDYVSNYRKLAFNVHPAFPRYWNAGIAGYDGSGLLLQNARAAGLQILYNESPWNWMSRPTQRDAQYQNQLQTLGDRAAETNPDWVFHDVEHLPANNPADPDFVARMVQEGLDPSSTADQQEMLLRLGTEIYRDTYSAVVGGMLGAGYAAGPAAGRPLCGSFQLSAGTGLLYWFDYNRLYPGYLQFSMPALYTAGHAEYIGQRLATIRKAQASSDVIPWLSTGCYGEFPSEWVRDQMLEAFLAGCRGVTYFSAQHFDGLDFYYHVQAINAASQIEDIIMDGQAIPRDRLACVGHRLPVKGLELPSGEAAILVANYRGPQNVPTPAAVPARSGLFAPFAADLTPTTYGALSTSAGAWTLSQGVATAADTYATAAYLTTDHDGTPAAMNNGQDWVAQITYREDDANGRQQFFKLSPDICQVYIRKSTETLLLEPGDHLLKVLKSLDNWHTLAFHYKAATSSMDVYVDDSLRLKDYRNTTGSYALNAVEFRGPISLGDVAVSTPDAQAGECPAGNAQTACAQIIYQVPRPMYVVDLDGQLTVGIISPDRPVFTAGMDKNTKVFHVRLAASADFDLDADVDNADFGLFGSCLSGPAIPRAEACEHADLDDDGDVDQADFGIFQRCYSGESRLPSPC